MQSSLDTRGGKSYFDKHTCSMNESVGQMLLKAGDGGDMVDFCHFPFHRSIPLLFLH